MSDSNEVEGIKTMNAEEAARALEALIRAAEQHLSYGTPMSIGDQQLEVLREVRRTLVEIDLESFWQTIGRPVGA